MSLFAVQLAENDEMVLVVDAAVVVARDGWWVFRNADDQPVATLPQTAVCTIDVLEVGDVRGRPWASLADQHRLSLTPGLTVPDPSPTHWASAAQGPYVAESGPVVRLGKPAHASCAGSSRSTPSG